MSTGSGGMTPITSTVTLVSYVTLAEANTYFDQRLLISAWDDASNDNRSKALNMAAVALDRLNYEGAMTSTTQAHQFPRDDEASIPQPMQDACCIIASKFLDDADMDVIREESRLESQAYGSVKQSFKDGDLPHLMSGIPSAEAWDLILPFLRQGGRVRFDRVS